MNVSWNGVGDTSIEEGGFEKIRGADGSEKYYLVGGGGGPRGVDDAYSMWVFSSDEIDGPYSPLASGFRLSGGGHHSRRFKESYIREMQFAHFSADSLIGARIMGCGGSKKGEAQVEVGPPLPVRHAFDPCLGLLGLASRAEHSAFDADLAH